jgi:NAD+ kinase
VALIGRRQKNLFRSVGLVARFDRKKAVKLAEDLAEHLTAHGLEVYAEETLVKKTKVKIPPIPLEKMRTDFIIAIGGDGTLLRTCITIPKPEPPILAINMGVRGFLTEIEPKSAFSAVDKCLNGNFEVEKYMKLSITADGLNFPNALNEVVISPDEPAKLLYAHIFKDGERILDCQSDGLMVATQTGSTGYSLSAGGPVLDPGVNAFVLTPIIPLSTFHPIVFPSNSELTIEVIKSRRTQILVDGHYRQIATSKLPRIEITRSKYETSFIRFKHNFYHRLRSRLFFKGIK